MKKHLFPTLGLILTFCFFLFIPQIAKAATPPAPSLLSPASGASVSAPLTISWSAVTDPSGIIAYNWQVSTSSTFSTITTNNSTMGATQDTVSGLGNGTYFWRVQSVNSNFVQSAWSAARSFTVTGVSAGALAAPTLGPTKGYSTFHPLEVMTFNWSAVQGATSYELQASTDPNFPVSTSFSMNNIPNPTYSFSTPNEGNYFARVFAVDSNGVLSAPSNVITFSISYNNPLPAPPNVISPTNAGTLTLPVTLTWSDVPNPQPSGYEVEIAKDSGFQTIEESDPQLNDPSRTVLSLTPGTKYWRVRSHQGDASPTTAAVTKWSASGSFTVSQAPAAPVSLAFTSNPLYSGNSTWVQIQLSTAAPSGGAVIKLTSSDPNAAPVPATVTMPGNTAWMQFQMKAGQVTTETPVTITASLNSGSASAQLTVLPPSIKSLSISPTTFNGGISVQAIAMLNGVAPANGASISFSSSSPAVQAPAAETVAAGSPSVVFQIPTSSVTANTPATVTATYNGQSVQTQITLTPQGQPSALSLNPSSVTGTAGSQGIVQVASAANTDQIFSVSSNNPAATVPSTVVIPAGFVSAGFNINTSQVSAQTLVTISVSGGGVTRSATLTLNPPPPAPSTANLSVTAGGRQGESISSTPAGIHAVVGSTSTAAFAPGTKITLTVSNGRDAIWSGACSSGGNKAKSCTFTLNTNSTVLANVQ
ncbi:MAG TPA: hypothetical protein VJV96_07270 [Candidatus Angelobacter sp.]|nr:hypothetical protein [Candidatus Angelobacter sp.]